MHILKPQTSLAANRSLYTSNSSLLLPKSDLKKNPLFRKVLNPSTDEENLLLQSFINDVSLSIR